MPFDPLSYTERCIRSSDPCFPQRLKLFPNMPSSIYVRGELPDPSKKSVAIVGARKCTAYGQQITKSFARVLAENDVQIISGFAFGIDTCAHKGALEGGGKTFAVLGCGTDIIYPRSNTHLYRSVLESKGGIISEYPPGTPALAHHFPIRNRIISALCDAVLVVEARVRSGSLITASYALEQGIQIFAVPGKISDSMSAGTNHLIYEGAYPALSPEHILSYLGLKQQKKEEKSSPLKNVSLSDGEKKVFALISTDLISIEQLCKKSSLDLAVISSALLNLELKGLIFQSVPGMYSRTYR